MKTNRSRSSAIGVVEPCLAERQVAIVTVPGADEQLVSALGDQISAAGGAVSARYTLTDDMVDPSMLQWPVLCGRMASSLTRAIFRSRCVFSITFAASATRRLAAG